MATEKRMIDANAALNRLLQFNVLTYFAEHYVRQDSVYDLLKNAPTVDAVEVKTYMALLEMYHDLRENFIDYVCSGTCNVAPYCLNRCEECVDKRGWCEQGSDKCHGFNPAEIILMDGDGNDK